MPRKIPANKSPRHILVDNDDWELLQQCYGAKSRKNIGAGNVICAIIHQRCQEIRARLGTAANQIQPPSDDTNAAQ